MPRKKVIEMRVKVRGYEASCAVCGKRFRARRSDARFCGSACAYKDWSARHRAPGMPRVPKAELPADAIVTRPSKAVRERMVRGYYNATCQVCKKTFRAKRADTRFCGKACGYKAWSAEHRAAGMPRTRKGGA